MNKAEALNILIAHIHCVDERFECKDCPYNVLECKGSANKNELIEAMKVLKG